MLVARQVTRNPARVTPFACYVTLGGRGVTLHMTVPVTLAA